LPSSGKVNISKFYIKTSERGGYYYRPDGVSRIHQKWRLLVAVDGIHHHILSQSSSCYFQCVNIF